MRLFSEVVGFVFLGLLIVRVCHENILAIRAQNNHSAETERDILLVIFS